MDKTNKEPVVPTDSHAKGSLGYDAPLGTPQTTPRHVRKVESEATIAGYCLKGMFMNEKACNNEAYRPTSCEQVANVISHGIAIIPSIFALCFLMRRAQSDSEFGCACVFGLGTTILFTVSTIYHTAHFWWSHSRVRFILHVADRIAIYIFIATSYTPWLVLRNVTPSSGFLAKNMLVIVWILVSFGIVYQILFHERYKIIETIVYIFVGLFPAQIVFSMETRTGVTCGAMGGLCYALGIIFFKMDGTIPCAHAIWHVHVLLGAAVQYYAVATHLVGGSSDLFSQPQLHRIHNNDQIFRSNPDEL